MTTAEASLIRQSGGRIPSMDFYAPASSVATSEWSVHPSFLPCQLQVGLCAVVRHCRQMLDSMMSVGRPDLFSLRTLREGEDYRVRGSIAPVGAVAAHLATRRSARIGMKSSCTAGSSRPSRGGWTDE